MVACKWLYSTEEVLLFFLSYLCNEIKKILGIVSCHRRFKFFEDENRPINKMLEVNILAKNTIYTIIMYFILRSYGCTAIV